MSVEFTKWPAELAQKYRVKGYWLDVPLSDILARQKSNSNVAVVDGDRKITYQDLNERSSRLATALHSRGIRHGDTALVHLGNSAELYVVYFALLKLGVVLVNALYSHRQLELESYASQIKPTLLIGDRKNPLFKDNKFLEHLRSKSPQIKLAVFNNDNLEDLSLNGPIDNAVLQPTPPDEVAFLNLSGGSTGTPKLIPRTHNDYYYSVRRSAEICRLDDNTRYLCAIPAAHNFPMSSPGALGVFFTGGQVILAPDPSAGSCFPLIQSHKVTMAALVPPAASLWLQEIVSSENTFSRATLESLKLLQVGGARLSPTLAAKLVEILQVKLQQVFGMAEGLVCYTRLDDDDERILTTQGLPMSEDDEVWAANEDGKPVAPGEVGVLMTQGPYTFRGYFNAPEHNAKSFNAKGFYCSGDLIAVDEDGRITIHGRQKDQINRGGEKISTEEIENLLLRYPQVVEAGLVAMDDDLMGEKSVAFIMTKAPVKSAQLRKFLREQGVAEYKLPDRFAVLDEMPLTAVGKVDKKQLRELVKSQF